MHALSQIWAGFPLVLVGGHRWHGCVGECSQVASVDELASMLI